ncbi:MAG: phage tail tape measure protein [Hyphomicrobiaceae bacterium]|nr:MAG: phage tail tape measure protein [Hyphomicrobiaceae bacterium]
MPERLEGEVSLGYREFTAGVDQVIAVSKKLESSVGNAMSAAEAQGHAALEKLRQELTVTTREIQAFSQSATDAAKRIDLRDLEQRFNAVAQTGAKAFSSILTSGGDFQEGLLRINTIAGLSQDELAGLGERLRTVGKEIGVSATPTATLASYYDVLSSGFTKTADASRVLEASLKLSSGGQADAADTTRALTAVLNAYGDTSEKAQLRADQFFQTVNLGVTTVPELSRSLGLVVSTASSAGVSFEELSAAIATATLRGQTTSSAIEGIRGTIASLITPTAGAQKEMARLGITINAQTLAQRGLLGTLQDINVATGGNVASINKLIEGQVGLATTLALVKDGGSLFAQGLDQITNAAGSNQKALDEVNKGANEAGKAFASSMERFKIGAAQAAIPIQTTLLKAMTAAVDIADRIPTPFKTAGLAMIGFGTAAAFAAGGLTSFGLVYPVLAGQLTALGARLIPIASAAWAVLNTELTLATANAAATALAVRGLGIAQAAAVAPVRALGAGITALGAGPAIFLGLGAAAISLASAYANATDELIKHNHELEDANQGLRKFQDAEGKTRAVKDIGREDAIKSSAKSLADRGFTADDLTQEILDTRKRAEETDNQQIKAFFTEQSNLLEEKRRQLIDELKKRGKESPTTASAAANAGQAVDPKEEERARKQREREEKAAFDEQFRNQMQEVEHSKASHALKIKQYQDLSKIYEQDGQKRRAIEDAIASEQKKIQSDKEKALKEQAKQDIQDAEVKNDQQRLKNLQELVKKYQEYGDIRRQIEDKIATVEARIQTERERQIKRTRDLKKDAADEEIHQAESNLDKLTRLQDRGNDTSDQQKSEFRKGADAAKRKVDLEVEEKSRGADAQTQKDAKDTGNREKLRIEEDYNEKVRVLDERTSQDKIRKQSDLKNAEIDAVSQRIDLYRQLAEVGAASESQIRSEIEERYKLQLESIALQEKAVRAQTDDADLIAQAERRAAVDRVKAENDKQQAIDETTKALRAQKKEQAAGSAQVGAGGVLSVAEFAASSGSLDLTGGADKKGDPKDIARKRKLLEAAQAGGTSGKDVKTTVDNAGVADALQNVAQALASAKKIDVGIEVFNGDTGSKIPSRVRKATVDGKGSGIENAGRSL